jgi:tRNA A-37 threonylcarbamoyl transferase component Bud32
MPADPLIGLKLGDYVVEDHIAAGGMGLVYRARHPLLKRTVAVKVLRAKYARDAEQTQRFLTEAQTLSAIRHQGIVDVFNFGLLPDGRQYMMMEFLAGETLDDLLKREGKLSTEVTLLLVDQMLEALAAAHKVGVIHRDLKPSNIFLVQQSNGTRQVKLLDFGLAKQLNLSAEYDPKAKASLIGGTPQYISPEQAEGTVATPRSDLYALGGVLFQMLSGRVAFIGDESGQLLRAQISQTAPTLSSVLPNTPRELDALVAQLLEKQPARRPASAEEVRQRLRAIAGEEPDAAAPRARSRAVPLVIGFGALAVVGAIGAVAALELFDEAPPSAAPPAVAFAQAKPKPAPKPAVIDEKPPAADDAKFKEEMAAAIANEKQMAAEHRDRDLVMGMKKLTEQGLPVGHEKETAEQVLAPALRAQIENQRVLDERSAAGSDQRTPQERLTVLRTSCKQSEWKRVAVARIDRELATRLAALTEEALPSSMGKMQKLRDEATRLQQSVDKAKTMEQCVDTLGAIDKWVAANVAL